MNVSLVEKRIKVVIAKHGLVWRDIAFWTQPLYRGVVGQIGVEESVRPKM